jgi:hypothetical protein
VADDLAGDHSDKTAYSIHLAGRLLSYTAKQQAQFINVVARRMNLSLIIFVFHHV